MTLNIEPMDWSITQQANLIDAVADLDGDRMRHLMRTAAERYGTDAVVADVLVPVLRTIGEMWEQGSLSVMHEHHASSVIRSAAGEFRRRHVTADAPRIVLGCPPGELHDLPCHLFALMLLERGVDPLVLGANSPLLAFANAVRATGAVGCVITALRPRSLVAHQTALRHLSRNTSVYLAGRASEELGLVAGAEILPTDWRSAADSLIP